MRLERLLQSQGFGTRRECRARIEAGEVAFDGVVHTDPDADLKRVETLRLDGVEWPVRAQLYLALHKPAGMECSHQPTHHPSVFSLFPPHFVRRGLQCVGRLDADTTGLLLLSDDGAFIHAATSPKRHVAKTYEVQLAHSVSEAQVRALQSGVVLDDAPTPVSAVVEVRGPQRIHLTIDEGKYHQVKRMVAAAGNHVAGLHRVRIGAYVLPATLAPGSWVELDEARALVTR